MEAVSNPNVSAVRLRIGVIMILLWWLPFYLLSPFMASALGVQDKHTVFVAIVIIQTALGVLGALLTGRQVAFLLKHTSFKKVPGVFWHLLRYGQAELNEQ